MGIDKFNDGIVYLQSLAINNESVVSQLFNRSIEVYKPIKLEEDKEKADYVDNWTNDWEIPLSRNYNPNTYEKVVCKLSLYQPCYLEKARSNPEKDFIKYLEALEGKIKWWWKNGDEHMRENFGVKYNDKGSTFQPDFIVLLNDGRLGIFDTKSAGYQEDDTKEKSDALQAYISEENQKGKKLLGGIIISEGNHLRLFRKPLYVKFKDLSDGWEYLKEVL